MFRRNLQKFVALFAFVTLLVPLTAGASPGTGSSVTNRSVMAQDEPAVPVQVTFSENVNVCLSSGFLESTVSHPVGSSFGITYSDWDADYDGAEIRVTLTATLDDGYVWADDLGEGWTDNGDGTATYRNTFQRTPCSSETVTVAPELPDIVQPTCTPDGMRTGADLTLPADTAEITYSIQSGTVAPGQRVVVHAQLAPHAAWDRDTSLWQGGWSPNSDVDALLIIDFDDPDCDPLGVVAPEAPMVTEPVCMQGGGVADPVVTLPADTAAITYSMQGDLVPGGNVTIVATLTDGYAWATSAGMWTPGWTVESDTTASMTVTFSDPDCVSIIDVVPEDPMIQQPVCSDTGGVTDPAVTFAATGGVSYALTGDVEPGETVTVVATLADGHAWNTTAGMWTAGWTVNPDNEREATATFQIDDPDCDTPADGDTPGSSSTPEDGDVPESVITTLPTTGSGSVPMAATGLAMLLLASLAAMTAAVAAWLRRPGAR